MKLYRGQKVTNSKQKCIAIHVPQHIQSFHPLIITTKQHLGETWRFKDQLTSREPGLDMRVSHKQLARALRILDTILKALEKQGVQVLTTKERRDGHTYAVITDDKVFFDLIEGCNQVKVKEGSYGTHKFIPSGKLILRIKSYGKDFRKQWSDGQRVPLERKVQGFIEGLWVAAEQIKQDRLKREAFWREHEEQQRIAAERARLIEQEKQRRQNLENQAVAWEKSRVIHAFIEAAVEKKGEFTPDSDFGKWVQWAKDYADYLDPLRPAPDGGSTIIWKVGLG